MSSVATDETAEAVLYPTVHVLSSYAHIHPLDPSHDDAAGADGLPAMTAAEWAQARKELVTLLAELGLEGEDEWVGEWVLATLCQKNAPPLTPLSMALLAPSTTPAASSSAAPAALPLLFVLEQLVPTLHPLDLSIPLLNVSSFAPRAREKEEDLEAGAWQVPKGGVGYIRESAMGEGGQLNERGTSACRSAAPSRESSPTPLLPRSAGINNLQTLANLVQHQTLAYQYPFSAFSFAQDLVFLVEGDAKGGTLLRVRLAPSPFPTGTHQLTGLPPICSQVDAKIKLQAKGSASSARKTREEVLAALPLKATLDRFRAVIARAKAGSLTVPPEVSEVRDLLVARLAADSRA